MTGPIAPPAPDLLDEVLPRYEAREVHEIFVAAPPPEVYRALEALTLGEVSLFRVLMGVRALPARLARPRRRTPGSDRPRMLDPDLRLLDWGLRGFTVLARRPGTELVIGGSGQPWRLAGGISAEIGSLAEFRAFDRPGFAKLALGFRLEEVPGGTRLITETRVDTTDPLAHRRFGAYWQVIRIGSGAIRRNWLRAIKRRAERSPVGGNPVTHPRRPPSPPPVTAGHPGAASMHDSPLPRLPRAEALLGQDVGDQVEQ
jgi:hypothetical protein